MVSISRFVACEPVQLGLQLNDAGHLDVTYDSPHDIYGFQFNVDGVAVTGVFGGAAADVDFSVSNSDVVVLGFSLTGAFIPAGSGILTTLDIVGDAGSACMSSLVVSGAAGADLDVTVSECLTVSVADAPCDDADSDGICDDVDDCVGGSGYGYGY